MIVALIQLPGIRDAFGVGMPSKVDMIEIGAFALLVMAAMEGVKYAVRRRSATL